MFFMDTDPALEATAIGATATVFGGAGLAAGGG